MFAFPLSKTIILNYFPFLKLQHSTFFLLLGNALKETIRLGTNSHSFFIPESTTYLVLKLAPCAASSAEWTMCSHLINGHSFTYSLVPLPNSVSRTSLLQLSLLTPASSVSLSLLFKWFILISIPSYCKHLLFPE